MANVLATTHAMYMVFDEELTMTHQTTLPCCYFYFIFNHFFQVVVPKERKELEEREKEEEETNKERGHLEILLQYD